VQTDEFINTLFSQLEERNAKVRCSYNTSSQRAICFQCFDLKYELRADVIVCSTT